MTPGGASPRVLVCDQSSAYAESLARFLGASGELEVVGVCGTGEEAVEALAPLSPDLVTIDLELSGTAGICAIEEIMRARPVPIVVVSNGVGRGSDTTAAALAAGAMEALPKAIVRLEDPYGQPAVALRRRLMRLARNGVKSGRRPTTPAPARAARPQPATVVGIAASAGGPAALEIVLAELPADFPLPVLVVQHITIGFTDGLIRRLDQRAALDVRIAEDGQSAKPGVWFPPDDAHLVLEPSMHLRLDRETVVGAHRPSADVLLESMASAAGAGAVGVVLTGMGRDGGRGVAAIRRAGGAVIAQDEATSAVFGMPRAAIEAGAQTVLPLSAIAGALSGLTTVAATA
jgi:two-component system chemotaxis response regulator CheB